MTSVPTFMEKLGKGLRHALSGIIADGPCEREVTQEEA